MRLIVITTDILFEGESFILNKLFEAGMPLLHLRKPLTTKSEMEKLLMQIKEEYYDRIVLHDHFELVRSFPLKGVHLNKRNPIRPNIKLSSVSCSCHSLENVQSAMENHDYLFLSPIFDSISKSGYEHAFTSEQLMKAKSQGLINEKVIALGGIDEQTITIAAGYGFGGVAVLGALWGNFIKDRDEAALVKRLYNFQLITRN